MRISQYLSPSHLESSRFCLDIVRGNIPPEAPAAAVLEDIVALSPDVAIFRCPAGDLTQIRPLINENYYPIHADTLIYYQGKLGKARSDELVPSGEEIVRAVGEDAHEIMRLAEVGFSGYRSHYHANPRFHPDKILSGYIEWASAYAGSDPRGVEAWVVRKEGAVVGFATCCPNSNDSVLEIPLVAISPNYSGRGTYTRLLGFLMREYHRSGLSMIVVSTQVWNYRVQRAWVRLGLSPDHAVETYHVNLQGKER